MITLEELAHELSMAKGMRITHNDVAVFGNLPDWHPDAEVDAETADCIREEWKLVD